MSDPVKDLSAASISKMIQQSMKAGDKQRTGVLRMLLTSVKNAEVAKMGELSEEETLAVVAKEVRRREEAAAEFEKAGRADRASEERAEAEILRHWLPEQLSKDDLAELVNTTVSEVGATSPAEMGKVMAALMPKIRGRADGKVVSDLVRKSLGG